MTSSDLFRFAELAATPWRNGGGSTYEVAVAPVGASMEDFDWRVSIAAVDAPGPFSTFAGVDRILTLVRGGSMLLTIDGRQRQLRPHGSVTFAGESSTSCEIPDGPTLDLNVMTRRDRARATVDLLDPSGGRELVTDGPAVLICLSGLVMVAETSLQPLDGLRRAAAGSATLDGSGILAVVRLLPTKTTLPPMPQEGPA